MGWKRIRRNRVRQLEATARRHALQGIGWSECLDGDGYPAEGPGNGRRAVHWWCGWRDDALLVDLAHEASRLGGRAGDTHELGLLSDEKGWQR